MAIWLYVVTRCKREVTAGPPSSCNLFVSSEEVAIYEAVGRRCLGKKKNNMN